MQTFMARLTVFFEDPFWVGVYERQADSRLEVCKITFGAEPRDYEVYDFLLNHWHHLHFSPPVAATPGQDATANPKRRRREMKKQLEARGIGTRSQQTLSLQREENKQARRAKTRLDNEAAKQRQFELRRQKRKEKGLLQANFPKQKINFATVPHHMP